MGSLSSYPSVTYNSGALRVKCLNTMSACSLYLKWAIQKRDSALSKKKIETLKNNKVFKLALV